MFLNKSLGLIKSPYSLTPNMKDKLAMNHKIDTCSSHITRSNSNVFEDLGFEKTDAELLKYESQQKILSEKLIKDSKN